MFKIKRLCPGSMLEREIAEIFCHITGKDLTPDSVIPAKSRTMSPLFLHMPDSWCSLFFLNIAMREDIERILRGYLFDARNAVTSAMSMGSPKSPRGICDMKSSFI